MYFFSLAQENVRGLVLNERCEMIVPVLFLISFLMAYHGPNGEMIGNVKLTIWQFEAVADIRKFLENIFFLFVIDCLGAAVNAFLIWTTCQINCFKILKNLQSEFWHIFGFQEALFFVSVKMIKNPLRAIHILH